MCEGSRKRIKGVGVQQAQPIVPIFGVIWSIACSPIAALASVLSPAAGRAWMPYTGDVADLSDAVLECDCKVEQPSL